MPVTTECFSCLLHETSSTLYTFPLTGSLLPAANWAYQMEIYKPVNMHERVEHMLISVIAQV